MHVHAACCVRMCTCRWHRHARVATMWHVGLASQWRATRGLTGPNWSPVQCLPSVLPPPGSATHRWDSSWPQKTRQTSSTLRGQARPGDQAHPGGQAHRTPRRGAWFRRRAMPSRVVKTAGTCCGSL